MYIYFDPRSSIFTNYSRVGGWITLLLSCRALPVDGQPPAISLPEEGRPALVSSRIMVKFRGDLDPVYAQLSGKLAEGLGAILRYLRPLAGGAHLLQAEGPVTPRIPPGSSRT